MKVLPLVLQFIFSGAVVVGATLLAKNFDSKWAGLLVALSTLTLLGLLFISRNTSASITERYLLSALLFMIPAAIYILSLFLLYGKIHLVVNLLISIIPFSIAVYVVQKYIN